MSGASESESAENSNGATQTYICFLRTAKARQFSEAQVKLFRLFGIFFFKYVRCCFRSLDKLI